MGKSQASIDQMRAYIKKVNPQVSDSVTKMIPLYITEELQKEFAEILPSLRAAWRQETSHLQVQQ